jgi:4-amino-4-deoxy-L-arabinose transferase-like glycosyltransferase
MEAGTDRNLAGSNDALGPQGQVGRDRPFAVAVLAVERLVARFATAAAWQQRLVLALLAALFFLPGQASLPVTDRDEARFVQASRQMVQSGDPIDIRFQDQPRYKKPVGIYWLQAAAMLASGRGADAPLWVQRLPSLLGAVAAVVLVQVAGAPLIGTAGAALAALVFAASLVLAGEARIAKTDAVLLALTLGAMAVLARAWMGMALPRAQVFAFWLCLGAAALVKGPIGPLIVGLAALAASVAVRDRSWLRPLADLPAILLGLAVLLPWFVAITARSGAEFWAASVGGDLLAKVGEGQEGKSAPPGTYLLLVWITFWPGALLLALGLPAIWAARKSRATVFLLAWVVPAWALFELVPTKLIHYPLPLYPALALLAVAAWQGRSVLGLGGRLLALAFLAVGPLLLVAVMAAAGASGAAGAAWPAALALPGAVLLALLAFAALARAQPHAPAAGIALLGAVTAAGAIGTLARMPVLWPSQALAPMMLAARPADCPAAALIAVGYSEPSLIRLTTRDTAFLPPADAAQRLGQGCAVVAVEDRAAAEFARLAGILPAPVGRVDGFAIGAGRAVGLSVHAVGPAP